MDIPDGAPPTEGPAMDAWRFTPARASAVLEVLRQRLPSRYEVQREIGRGGSALVFLAFDRERSENVAIKVLRPELAEAMSAARFVQEVEIARHLEHPGVLPLYDSGALGSLPYFVMPFVEGDTLRMHLTRYRELPLGDVVRIARGIAEALDYAHGLSLVHRDIKPANILLDHDRVIVADFGIARAIARATLLGPDSKTIGTPSGIAIGTPEYMCPEQAGSDRLLDGRADVYSLGCVVYEMIAGEPPFTGPTPSAIVARHCYEAPRSLRVVRPTISESAQRVVERALAKVPADRFASAGEFVSALEAALADVREPPFFSRLWRSQGRTVVAGLTLLLLAIAAVLVPRTGREWRRRSVLSRVAALVARADTTKYAVLPVRASGPLPFDMAELLRAALRRWDGIHVVDSAATRASVDEVPNDLAVRAPNLPALIAGAGRYIAAEAVTLGDSLRIRATLRDARTDSALAEGTLQIARGATDAAASVARLGDRLVFADFVDADDAEPIGTSSVPARSAYLRARAALARWELDEADSGFRSASRIDPQYAQALLRLALVRHWAGVPVQQWNFVAEQAQQAAARLTPNEHTIADALVLLVHGRRGEACARWKDLTERTPRAFDAWYGLGNCLFNDSLVLRDEKTPNQWSFREDGEAALTAFDQAIRLQNVISRPWIENVRELVHAGAPFVKTGHTSDGASFLGDLTWKGSSFDLAAVPASEFDANAAKQLKGRDEAVLHARQHYHSIAQMWRARRPDNPLALEAVGEALDLLGNSSAIDSVHLARQLASTTRDRVRLGVFEVWLRTKYSAPDKPESVRQARLLADSLLRADSAASPNDAPDLGTLAVLTGRAGLATRYARVQFVGSLPVDQSAPALVTYAALGGPPDTLRAIARALERGLVEGGQRSGRDDARADWLRRSALLALPDSSITRLLPPSSEPRVNLLTSWRAHDAGTVERILAAERADPRRPAHAFDIPVTDVYSAAAALASLGDAKTARATLEPYLDSLALVTTSPLHDISHAAALVRTFALRAELAASLHDTATARRWARMALVFWSDADECMQPVVDRLRRRVESRE